MIHITTETRKGKRLFLIFHGRFPSNKAASLFAAKSAEAFAEQGLDVELVVSRRLGRETGNPYGYYKVKDIFRIVYLPVLDLPSANWMNSVRFALSSLSFSLFCYWYLLRHAGKEDVIYSNESLPLLFASFSFPRTFYEMHDFPAKGKGLFGFFIRRMRWVLIHNDWKADSAKKAFALEEENIFREPNAVQMEDFDISLSKEEAREKLSLSHDKKIVVYTGHLYAWKGVDTLARAAHELSDQYLVVFVGGTPEDVKKLRDAHTDVDNLLITGWKPHAEIPLWQKAADVLVLPNTAKENISKYYTSPMKLFEYMASGVPIVASRLPSIEEIVTDGEVFFVPPDDASALAQKIQEACRDTERAEIKASAAYRAVTEHTWQKRAARIISFIRSRRVGGRSA